jgi:predicted nucleotide-binding protein
LELGYFVGKLGRNRVCALHKGSIALPSDILGVAYVPMDESGGWKLLLAKELRAAGFDVDLNRAI